MTFPDIAEVTELSEDERLEYVELCNWARHDDTMIYQAASTILPLSFGAIAVAAQFPKMLIPLAIGSATLYVYWLLISIRLSWYSSVRLGRLRSIEAKAGLEQHLLLKSPPKDLALLPGARLSIRTVRLLGAIALLVSWVVVIAQKPAA